jgi:hypothetical protein
MSIKLILALLNQKKSQEGFTTVIAVGIGLIMLLSGATMMIRSEASRTSANAQKETAASFGIAETGITRSLSQLNTPKYYPYLVKSYDLKPHFKPTAVNEWSTPITQEVQDLCKLPSGTIVNDLTNEVILDSATGTKYQLLAYSYAPLATTPSLSTTPVKIGDGKILLQGNKNNGARSNLEVSTDVQLRILPASFPGLYASSAIDLSGADILQVSGTNGGGNIICANCGYNDTHCNTLNTKTKTEQKNYILDNLMGATSEAIVEGQVYLSSVVMPPITPPTATCALTTITDKNQLKDCKIVIPQITSATTLPRPSDISALSSSVQAQLNNTDTSYYFNYEIQGSDSKDINLSGSASEKLTIKTDKGPVRLYVSKNITMSGSANMEHTDTGIPERFALFGIGSSTQSFVINGAASTTGMFLYAPNANLRFNGAAGANPDILGAIWVKSFDNNGNNFELKVPDNFGSTLGDIYGNDYNLGIKVYSTSAPKSWERVGLN